MDTPPLVIVEGFMSSAGALIWGNFEEHSNYDCRAKGTQDRSIVFASVGPVSSLHDRACELFYSLVGGTVDYGAKHSLQCGHRRYGRTHEVGLYPEWSVDHPLHFLGHSMGGPTIMKLQWLLSTGFFGNGYRPDMILSVTTISSPFRGTQLVYSLGEDVRNAPDVRPLSAGDLLAKGVHVLSYLAPLLPRALDLHADARALSFRDVSLRSLLGQLWKSDWAESRDATPFDATFQAAEEREDAGEGAPHPRTYYRSYCATLGRAGAQGTGAASSLLQKAFAWPLYLSSRAMVAFDFATLRPTPSFLKAIPATPAAHNGDERYMEEGIIDADETGSAQAWALRANDGVVPLFSQWHPFECDRTQCKHVGHPGETLDSPKSEGMRAGDPLDAGIWHVRPLEDAHHLSIVPLWVGAARQKAFWREVGDWLRAIDEARADGGS